MVPDRAVIGIDNAKLYNRWGDEVANAVLFRKLL